ncbi:hypothetical protein TNCV_2117931 [Trichonephila clavipes]|nr:hypothetical protein TNCV_2117931 [Trichonephila clavipes]
MHLRPDHTCESLRWDDIGMLVGVSLDRSLVCETFVFPHFGVYLKVEYITPTKVTREAESCLLGRGQYYYPAISPIHLSRGGL